jgi:DNA polymerase-3 subunit delta'
MTAFCDIQGRQPFKKRIKREIQKGRISHGYILEGPKGSGKKLIADAFAELLFCETPDGLASCGKCSGCMGYKEKYVLETQKTITVEDIRSIIADTELLPMQSDRKVYIIHEADSMTLEAQNAFLKTLEDPPSYCLFILTVTNSEEMIETIRSRCITIYTGVNTSDEVLEYLKNTEKNHDEEEMKVASDFCEGSIGRAKNLLSDEDFRKNREYAQQYLKTYTFKDIDKDDMKDNIPELLEILQSFFRDMLVYKMTGFTDNLINTDKKDMIKGMADLHSKDSLYKVTEIITKTAEYIKDNVSVAIAVGTMNIEIAEEMNR